MTRRTRLVALLAAVAAVAMLAGPGASSKETRSHVHPCAWRTVATAAPAGARLLGVDATGPNDVWVAGGVGDFVHGTQRIRSFIEHWDGRRWRVTKSPDVTKIGNFVASVAAVSPHDVWAVGSLGGGVTGAIMHWDGSRWRLVQRPRRGSATSLYDVSAIGSDDVWAIGAYLAGNSITRTLAEHWNGTTWTFVSSPDPGAESFLARVDFSARTSGWAVGSFLDAQATQQAHGVVMRWDGNAWNVVRSFATGLIGVSAGPRPTAWAVGGGIVRTDGTTWGVVTYPRRPGDDLRDVLVLGRRNVWVVGHGRRGAIALHWNGRRWIRVPTPRPFGQASNGDALTNIVAASSRELWAVGYATVRGVSRGLVMRYSC